MTFTGDKMSCGISLAVRVAQVLLVKHLDVFMKRNVN